MIIIINEDVGIMLQVHHVPFHLHKKKLLTYDENYNSFSDYTVSSLMLSNSTLLSKKPQMCSLLYLMCVASDYSRNRSDTDW